jgi:hypothetical protein
MPAPISVVRMRSEADSKALLRDWLKAGLAAAGLILSALFADVGGRTLG